MKDYGKALTGLLLIVSDQRKQISDLTTKVGLATDAAPDADDAAKLAEAQAVIAAAAPGGA